MKKIIVLFALILGMANVALADEPQAVVNGPGSQPVKGSRFGNCVVTKWSSSNDPCAPPPAPTPVAVQAPPPPPPPQPVMQLGHEQLTIYFDFNKASITAASASKLNDIADAVSHSPRVLRVNIVGYTDEIGTNDYNEKLSTKRADAVKAYLDKKIHIDVNVLGLRGLGEADPVVDCSKVKVLKKKIACMAKDRRVEIEFEFQK